MDSLIPAIRQLLRSPGFKFFVIAALILLLTIPLILVWLIIEERSQRANTVAAQIASEWGKTQRINGPFLVVPYTVARTVTQGDKQIQERRAIFLPSQTTIAGKATPKVLTRSIYTVTVYQSALQVSGRFEAPNIAELVSDAKEVRWQDAILAVGIADVSGLKSTAAVKIDGARELVFDPSLGMPGYNLQGIHARIGDAAAAPTGGGLRAFDFAFALELDGSSGMFFAPIARDTVVTMDSPWPHPSFTGSFLPTERQVTAQSFSARWQIPHLARSVPHGWTMAATGDHGDGPEQRLSPFGFGVNFYIPVDTYDLAARAAKYALMFLATAFMAVFLIEMRSGRSVHAVQYLLVGIAMVFFYVMLLALAEHIGFALAYVSAAAATSTMLALYIAKAQASARKGIVMLGVLAALYTLLYLILRLEDYALLAGAIGGFAMLTVVMFATLKVDWSGQSSRQASAA